MTSTLLESWKQALYLHERKTRLNKTSDTVTDEEASWYQRTGLATSYVDQRLLKDGLNRQAFKSILTEKDNPDAKGKIIWIETLEHIFDGCHLQMDDIHFENEKLHHLEFLSFAQPFLKYTKLLISHVYRKWGMEKFIQESVIQDTVLKAVYENLIALSMRVLIYELNLARIEGRLKGVTPEARFADFIDNYITHYEDIYQCLSKYPVLARLMVEAINRWKGAICEFAQRLKSDLPAIKNSFGYDFDKVIDIQTGAGDFHREGRSVFILTFSTGANLVYKPRSMSVDSHFNSLIGWINQRASIKLHPVRLIDCKDYGWQEFAKPRECDNSNQIKNFYWRLGAYISIFHMLHATDIHMENMIASGAHPQFIDLESLFQNFNPVDLTNLTALQKASDELTQSVLRTAILPASLFKSGSFRSIEVSGIGGHAGQRLPRPIYKFAYKNTDKMRMIKTVGFHKGADNRPIYKGEEVPPENYIDDIVKGFKEVYTLFVENREELLEENGPVMAFQNDKVRSLFRNTQSYMRMLEASLNPDNLKNGLDRVRLFDYLWRVAEFNPKLAKVIHSETRDLLSGDVPYFYTRVDSSSAWDIRGEEFKDFYESSPLQHTLFRIQNFDRNDCEKQIRYIRISMETMLKRWDFKKYRSDISNRVVKHPVANDKYLQQAIDIGDKLLKSAFWGDDKKDLNWIGVGASLNNRWLFTPLDATLYDGVLGVALFYAYLSEVSGINQYKRISQSAVRSADDFLEKYDLGSPSAFHGYASVAYILSHLGVLWNDKKYLKKALETLYKCENWIHKDNMYDLIGGVSGTLLVALRLFKLTGSEKAHSIAVSCGEHLIHHAREMGNQVGWVSSMDNETALVGLSHGTAGIAWALAELYGETKDERYQEYSRRALLYERSMFIEEEGNWADLRYREDRKRLGITTPAQWCHGAAGIALGRLMTKPYWEDQKMREEISIAMETTLREGFGGSHCQCHGDFGNLEVFLLAAKVLKKPELEERAQELGTSILKESREKGWFCGIPQSEETPGFMLGLAGVGHGLLRLAAPSKVPSVVVLEGPREKV